MPSNKEYSLIEAIEVLGAEVDPQVDVITVRVVGPAKSPIVRVYIDYPGGVNFDVLQRAQVWISRLLDELDPFAGTYTLEVSSPGLDRPLRKPEHFKAAIGKTAKIKTAEKIDDRKAFTGKIKQATDDEIVIELDEKKSGQNIQVKIPFGQITSANLKDLLYKVN